MSILQNIKIISLLKLKKIHQKKHLLEFVQIVGENKNGKVSFIH